MGSYARARSSGLLVALNLSLVLTLATESPAQSTPWFLGVKTETMNVNRRHGDPPGQVRPVPQPPPFYVLRITEVIQGSAASTAELEEGDMIVSVNGQRVMTPEQLHRQIRGSNGVLNLKLKDFESSTGYKAKTIDLRQVGGRVIGGSNGNRPQNGPIPTELEELFVPHMGIYYKKVPYDNGTFGAQLTRDAVPGSPATQIRSAAAPQPLRLERGDTIFEMDGQRFRTDDEVRNHRSETTMRFVDSRTGQAMTGSFTLP